MLNRIAFNGVALGKAALIGISFSEVALNCTQWSGNQTQILIPVILFLAEKRWLEKMLWKQKFRFSLGLCEVR